MADEQIIYLSPEEELTNVRERLERIPTRRIILVVPTQTQLRSHVSWRLLYARARELNKEVLVISSDRQIRSVVKAVVCSVLPSSRRYICLLSESACKLSIVFCTIPKSSFTTGTSTATFLERR